MNARDFEAAWVEQARSRILRPAPAFEDGKLVFGAATEIANLANALDQEPRTLAILSAAYLKPIDPQALRYLRRAFAAQARGDVAMAAVHIAMAGFGTFARPELAARRAFLSDRLLRLGTTPETILKAVGLDPGANALAKYDESEPRNPAGSGRQSGEWTDGDPLSFFARRLAGGVLSALARWAAIAVGTATAALSLRLLILSTKPPGNAGDGKVPGHDDLEYHWDELDVQFHVLIDGRWVTLTQGRLTGDLYLDASGRPIARKLDGTIVADMDALEDARKDLPGGVGGGPPGNDPGRDGRGPKLCPAPVYENQDGWSARARAYQAYVTGLGQGLQVWLNGVSFDGCRESDGTMLEAKDNYRFLLDDSGNWKPWVENPDSPLNQMRSQSAAAALDGRNVEWHASQKGYAIYLESVRGKPA